MTTRTLSQEIESLIGTIEAVRGSRDVLRVSGNYGNSQDVGVIGIESFNDLMRRTIEALREQQ